MSGIYVGVDGVRPAIANGATFGHCVGIWICEMRKPKTSWWIIDLSFSGRCELRVAIIYSSQLVKEAPEYNR